MRYAALLLVLGAACSFPMPYVVTAPAPAGAAALDCAANKITALGYTVRERNANAVLATTEAGSLVIHLNAEIFTEGGVSRLRVTNFGRSGTQELGSIGESRAQADQVLAECGR